jgi:hypothetical protein
VKGADRNLRHTGGLRPCHLPRAADRVKHEKRVEKATHSRLSVVPYLHKGDALNDADWDATPEGHGLSFNAAGGLVGLTIVRPKTLLERHGKVEITLPPQHVLGEYQQRPSFARTEAAVEPDDHQ